MVKQVEQLKPEVETPRPRPARPDGGFSCSSYGIARSSQRSTSFTTDMTDRKPQPRRFYPTPAWLIFGLLVVEGLLWLSERFQWFGFNCTRAGRS